MKRSTQCSIERGCFVCAKMHFTCFSTKISLVHIRKCLLPLAVLSYPSSRPFHEDTSISNRGPIMAKAKKRCRNCLTSNLQSIYFVLNQIYFRSSSPFLQSFDWLAKDGRRHLFFGKCVACITRERTGETPEKRKRFYQKF